MLVGGDPVVAIGVDPHPAGAFGKAGQKSLHRVAQTESDTAADSFVRQLGEARIAKRVLGTSNDGSQGVHHGAVPVENDEIVR